MNDRETELLEENRKLLQVNEKLQKEVVRYHELRRIVLSLLSNADGDLNDMRDFVDRELQ